MRHASRALRSSRAWAVATEFAPVRALGRDARSTTTTTTTTTEGSFLDDRASSSSSSSSRAAGASHGAFTSRAYHTAGSRVSAIAAASIPRASVERAASTRRHELAHVRGKKKKAKGKDKGAASAASAAADDDDASDASDDVSDDASDDAPAVEFDKAVVSALMDAAVEALERDLGKLRTGRASPGMLESLVVDAYGEPTPLRNLGSVTARNAQTLAVMLYDPTLKGAVQNAITESPLGFNPQEDGDGTLLVPVPEMTHETKVQVAKLCHRAGETAKISVRNARRKGMDVIKKATMTEDEGNRAEKDVQKMSEAFVKKIEELVSAKEKAILK